MFNDKKASIILGGIIEGQKWKNKMDEIDNKRLRAIKEMLQQSRNSQLTKIAVNERIRQRCCVCRILVFLLLLFAF